MAVSYLERAYDDLKSAKLLYSNHAANAIALGYYSLYHASLSLLALHAKQSKSHTKTIVILAELGYDTSLLKSAKKLREHAQYDANPDITTIKAKNFLQEVELSISTIAQKVHQT